MAETERFKLTLRMDATVTVYDAVGQASDWLKPGTEVSHTWKGMPTDVEITTRYASMKEVAAVTLEDVIVAAKARIDKELRGH